MEGNWPRVKMPLGQEVVIVDHHEMAAHLGCKSCGYLAQLPSPHQGGSIAF